jgi:hypothetical protein
VIGRAILARHTLGPPSSLDYVQLNAYFAGVEDWTRLRQEMQKRGGASAAN